MNILVTGTLSYDYIMDFPGFFADRVMPDKIHSLSLSFLVDKLHKEFGGTAGNIAYSLKLLGMEPVILSTAGNDFEPYRKFLDRYGIKTDGIININKTPTGTYFCVTDKNDNQIGAFYKGAAKYTHTISLKDYVNKRNIEPEKLFAVLSATDPKATMQFVNDVKNLGISYLFDPSFNISDFSDSDLAWAIEGSAILIGNDYEISLIEKKLGISHEELIIMTKILITTLGPKGSIIETRNDSIFIKPAKARSVKDPTGAGDAYRAGFIAGYLRKLDLATAGLMGSILAVYTVEKYGTVTHNFTIEDFNQRFKDNFGQDLLL